jgi:hypothetical protein
MLWEDKLRESVVKVNIVKAKRLRLEQERCNTRNSYQANGLQDNQPKEQLISQQPSEEGQSRLR